MIFFCFFSIVFFRFNPRFGIYLETFMGSSLKQLGFKGAADTVCLQFVVQHFDLTAIIQKINVAVHFRLSSFFFTNVKLLPRKASFQQLTCAHRPRSAQLRYWNIFKANSYGSSMSKKGMSLTSFCKRKN